MFCTTVSCLTDCFLRHALIFDAILSTKDTKFVDIWDFDSRSLTKHDWLNIWQNWYTDLLRLKRDYIMYIYELLLFSSYCFNYNPLLPFIILLYFQFNLAGFMYVSRILSSILAGKISKQYYTREPMLLIFTLCGGNYLGTRSQECHLFPECDSIARMRSQVLGGRELTLASASRFASFSFRCLFTS